MMVSKNFKKLVCVCAVLVLAGCGASTTSTEETTNGPSDDNKPSPVAVTSLELGKAYDDNEAAAQLKYGKSPLLVSGTVKAITLDLMDNPVVEMAGIDMFNDVSLELAEAAKPRAVELKKGQKLVLLCNSVSEVMGSPMVSDCTFPVEPVTASKDEKN